MKQYTFKKSDSGYLGKAFEMAIKDALNRKNANRVSPCGSADFRYLNRNYEVKQNGGVLRYASNNVSIKGSNKVIYATHVKHSVVSEDEETITITIDLGGTDLLVVNRYDFLEFLDEIGCIKVNASRGTANIQTVYNYKLDKYHGAKGKAIEAWAEENEADDDDIIGAILDGEMRG